MLENFNIFRKSPGKKDLWQTIASWFKRKKKGGDDDGQEEGDEGKRQGW